MHQSPLETAERVFRLVDCETWLDTWFEALEPPAKLFFLYLITNPRSTTCGAFEISERKMAFETGLPFNDIQSWLQEWAPRVMWWPEHNIVFLRNFYRKQHGFGPKVEANAKKVVAELPREVQVEIGKEYPALVPDLDTLSIPYASPSLTEHLTQQRQNTTETETGDSADEPRAKPRRASAMTEDWFPDPDLWHWTSEQSFVAADVDREIPKFRNHYIANGKPMKDWRAAFRGWMLRSREWGAPRASPSAQSRRATPYDFVNDIGLEERQ